MDRYSCFGLLFGSNLGLLGARSEQCLQSQSIRAYLAWCFVWAGAFVGVACTPTHMLPPVRFVILKLAIARGDGFECEAVQEFESVFDDRPVVRVCLVADARE